MTTDAPKPGPIPLPAPKPGPVIPPLATRGAGVNQNSVEMRARLMQLILSNGINDVDTILTLMDRMEIGPDFDDEEEET